MSSTLINIISLIGLIGGFTIKTNGKNFLIYLLIFLTIPLAVSTEAISFYEIGFLLIFLSIVVAVIGFHFAFKTKLYFSDHIALYFGLFIFALLGSVLIAYFSGVNLFSSLRAAYPFSLLILLFYIRLNFKDKHKKYLLWSLVLAGFVISFECIIFVLKSGYLFKNPLLGESGTPFNSGLYLFIIPFFFVLLFYVKRRGIKSILSFLFFLFAWRFLINFRRHTIFIFLFSIILVIYFSRFQQPYWKILKSKIKVIFPLVTVGIVLLAGWGIFQIVSELNIQALVHRLSFQSILLGLKTRFTLDFKAWDYFLKNPVFGIGLGKNVELLGYVSHSSFSESANAFRQISVNKVHNLYLYILMNGGLVLFIPFVAFIANLYKKLKYLLKQVSLEPIDFYWCVGGLIFLVNFLILGMFSVKTISLEAWLVLALVSGITMSIHEKYKLRFK